VALLEEVKKSGKIDVEGLIQEIKKKEKNSQTS